MCVKVKRRSGKVDGEGVEAKEVCDIIYGMHPMWTVALAQSHRGSPIQWKVGSRVPESGARELEYLYSCRHHLVKP